MRRPISLSLSLVAGALLGAGCGALFPSGGGGAPPGTKPSLDAFTVHNVRVNTVGYVQGRAKVATVMLPPGMTSLSDMTAQVVDASGNVDWTCTMTGPMTAPAFNGAVYYFADFTAFDNAGTYTINVPALGTDATAHSAPFLISSNSMLAPLTTAMTGMYGQRCGTAVKITMGSDTWKHGACHQHDADSLKYLTICLQSHDQRLLNLDADESFASLRGDPAFRQLLAKIGLPAI